MKTTNIHVWNYLKSQSSFSSCSSVTPSENVKFLNESANILVVGAGGLGCEVIKNLIMMGFRNIHIVDFDTIELTNLSRQILYSHKDIGRSKAIVAAEYISNLAPGGNIKGYNLKAEEISFDFYKKFHVIMCVVDSLDTRRWLNYVVHSNVRYEDAGEIINSSVVPLIDGGTEGLKGHVRVVIPAYTSCIECTLSYFSTDDVIPICSLSRTPRRMEHCLELARTLLWDTDKPFDKSPFNVENQAHFDWVYNHSIELAKKNNIPEMSSEKALNIIKRIVPATIGANSAIAALCVTECFKLITSIFGFNKNGFIMFNLENGIHSHEFQPEQNPNCAICSKPTSMIEVGGLTTIGGMKDMIYQTLNTKPNKIIMNYFNKISYRFQTLNIDLLNQLELRKSLNEFSVKEFTLECHYLDVIKRIKINIK